MSEKSQVCTHAPPSEVGRLMSASVVGVVEARLMVALLYSSSASDPVCLKCDIPSPSLTMYTKDRALCSSAKLHETVLVSARVRGGGGGGQILCDHRAINA